MKKGIHPDYVECHVRCSCGNEFVTRSTKSEIRLDICNVCHPFYTGTQKLIDTGGRVQRFANRFGNATETVAKREADRKAKRASAAAAAEEKRATERAARAKAKQARAAKFAEKAAAEQAKAETQATQAEDAASQDTGQSASPAAAGENVVES